MKNLLFSILALVLISSSAMFGGNNDHRFSICNINRNAANTVQFDIYMKNISETPTDTIYIQAPTFNINYNYNIRNSGTMSATLVSSNLPSANRTNNPTVRTSGADYVFSANGKTGKIPNGDGTAETTYILLPGDSVLCGRYQLKTSASTFAVAPLNLTFRPFGGTSPVTSCAYFKRFDEIVPPSATGTGPYIIDGVEPVLSTLSTTSNETYVNIDAVGNTELPVELTTFSATTKGRDVSLAWHTATEVNFSKFVVERSANGSAFTAIATYQAAGNSNSDKAYAHLDKKLNSGSYSYRLKMVDVDGSYQYSKQVETQPVALPKQYEISQNYPNPFNPSAKIDYQLAQDSHVTLELYNISGQKVAEVLNDQQAAGYYTVDVSPSVTAGLASGVYLYRIAAIGKTADSKFVSIKKMILMK